MSFNHGTIVEHFKLEIENFVAIKDISKNTNLLIIIPTLIERWHCDKINTHKKVQILILGYFRNLSSSHGSIVEHLKQEIDNFVTIKDISKNSNLLMTIPTIGETQHLDTLKTQKKFQILILGCFQNLRFSHGSIVEHFKLEIDNFVTIKDISKNTNFLIIIPILIERWHFDKLNTHKKVQILILGYFQNLSSSHWSIVEHIKKEIGIFFKMKDISKNTNFLMTIPTLGESQCFDTLKTQKKFKILSSGCFWNFSYNHGSTVENFKLEIGIFVTIKDISNNTKLLMTIPTLDERQHFDTLNTQKQIQILIPGWFWNLGISQNHSRTLQTRNRHFCYNQRYITEY